MSYCTYCKHDASNGGDESECDKCSEWDESWEDEYGTSFDFEQAAKYDGFTM